MGLGRLFMDDEDDDDEKHRLHDIRVDEVSPVDRAANRRRFLIIKRSEDMGDSPEVVKDKDGNLITNDGADKANISIPGPVKEAVTRSATEALNRLQSFVNMVKTATATEEQSKTPLPAKLGGELKAISGLLGGIGEKYPSPMSKDDGTGSAAEDDVSAKILAAIDDLKKLLAAPAAKADDATPPADPPPAEPPPALDASAIAKAFDGLSAEIKKQNEQIAEIRKSHGGSQGIVPEGDGDGDKKPGVFFPLDMAAEFRANEGK